MRYGYGILSYYDHRGLWKNDPTDPDVTRVEYDQVYCAFDQWLKEHVVAPDPLEKYAPCYFIGDSCPDRTQHLEFNDFAAMTPDLVRNLQELLRMPQYRKWRIALGTGLPEDIIIVYPEAVCGVRPLLPEEVGAAVRETSRRIRERDAKREEERRVRLDRVRPLLPQSYERALTSDRPVLVTIQLRVDGREGVALAWVLHPIDEDLLEVYEYSTYPSALLREKRYVLPQGVLLETDRPKPPKALFLAGWEFEETSGRNFTMEQMGRVTTFNY